MSKQAFTLVELLVVVTILAILTSMASVYFFDSFQISRDASRSANLENITRVLDLHRNDSGTYPHPDDPVDITYNGETAWTQWVFWKGITQSLRNFWSEIFTDPKYDTFFTYSTTNKDREYQIATIYEELEESQGIAELVWIPTAYAVVNTAKVYGDFNNFMVRTQSGEDFTYIASPSIIASDISNPDVISIISNQKLVYDEFFNLPASYSDFLETHGGFDFNVSDPILFSGTNEEIKSPEWLESFVEKLHYVYSRTPTESFDRYASFLEEDWYARMKEILSDTYKISFFHAFSCQDIYDQWLAFGDGFYDIDPDGAGPLELSTRYCDIRRDGSAWTQIGGNYIWENGGDFVGQQHISTNYFSLYEWYAQNSIVDIENPWKSEYVIHQTGGPRSHYQVHFNDISDLQIGNEIWMSLWVANETDAWSNTLWINPESGYMFHNRLYYTDGTFTSNGETEILDTQVIDGRTWRRIQVLHRVRKDPQNFAWYIGLDAEDNRDLYFTGVKLELFYR